MTCLITGGSGYIGSCLAYKLLEQGHEVHVLDLAPPGYAGITYHAYDLGDSGWVEALPPVDTVYHLAAVSRIADSLASPEQSFRTNVTGTGNALAYALRHNAAVVYASTSCCYDALTLSPYHHTKWMGEQACALYAAHHGMSIATARLFNVYGRHPFFRNKPVLVLDVFEKALREGRPLPLIAEGRQRRDFIHVEDVAEALMRMGEGHWRGDIFNIGTGIHHSIAEIAGWTGARTCQIPGRPFDVEERVADLSQTHEKLGWKARIALEPYMRALAASLRKTDI